MASASQVSLPKFIFGHNARLPNKAEVIHGLQLMAEYIEEKSKLPFDAMTATVNLIHFAYDIHLTEPEVWQMIEKLSKRILKPLRKQFLKIRQFISRQNQEQGRFAFIQKLQKVLSEKNAIDEAIKYATGNLRFESCFLEKSSIDALVKHLDLPDSNRKVF